MPDDENDPIREAMGRAPDVEWLTPEQRTESDEALERLRGGRARLVKDADRAETLAEIAAPEPLDLDAIEAVGSMVGPCCACGLLPTVCLCGGDFSQGPADIHDLVAEVRRLRAVEQAVEGYERLATAAAGRVDRAIEEAKAAREEAERLRATEAVLRQTVEAMAECVRLAREAGHEERVRLDKTREEARLWRELAFAWRAADAADAASAHPGQAYAQAMTDVRRAQAALRAAGIDPDAPEPG